MTNGQQVQQTQDFLRRIPRSVYHVVSPVVSYGVSGFLHYLTRIMAGYSHVDAPNYFQTGTLAEKVSALSAGDPSFGLGLAVNSVIGTIGQDRRYALVGILIAQFCTMRDFAAPAPVGDPNFVAAYWAWETFAESLLAYGVFKGGKKLHDLTQPTQPAQQGGAKQS